MRVKAATVHSNAITDIAGASSVNRAVAAPVAALGIAGVGPPAAKMRAPMSPCGPMRRQLPDSRRQAAQSGLMQSGRIQPVRLSDLTKEK